MKTKFVLKKFGFVIALVSASIYTQAKTFTAVASGDWSSNATWQGSDAPGNVIGAGDQVIISTGLTVDLNSDIEIDGLLARLDVEGTLNAANNSIQTIDGTISGSGTITSQNFWIASAGNFSFDGDLETDEFVNQSLNLIIFAAVTVHDSVMLRAGNISLNSNSQLMLSTDATVIFEEGLLDISSGLFSPQGEFNVLIRGESKNIGSFVLNTNVENLIVRLDGDDKELTLVGDINIEGQLRLERGVLVLNGNRLNLEGDIYSSLSAEIRGDNDASIQIMTNTAPTGMLRFENGNNVIGELSIDIQDGSSMQLGSNLEVFGSLTLSNGNLNIENRMLTLYGDLNTTTNATLESNENTFIVFESDNGLNGSLNFDSQLNTVGMLSVDISNGTLSLKSDVNINDTLVIRSGNTEISGALTFSGNADLVIEEGMLSLEGNGSANTDNSINLTYLGNSVETGIESTFNNISNVTIDLEESSNEITLTSDLMINTKLNVDNGILTLNGNQLTLKGDVNFEANSGIQGDEMASLTINATSSFDGYLQFTSEGNMLNNFEINIQDGGRIVLDSELEVISNLNLSSGQLVLIDADLTLMANAQIQGASRDNYIITSGMGRLILNIEADDSENLYPLGTDQNYSPILLTQASSETDGMFAVRVGEGVFVDGESGNDLSLTKNVVDRTWFVDNESNVSSDVTLTMMWEADAEVNNFDNSNCFISHYFDANWDVRSGVQANTETNGMLSVSRSGITSFSPFAVTSNSLSNVANTQFTSKVKAYPNPIIGNVLNIEIEDNQNTADIKLYSVQGRVIKSIQSNNNSTRLNMADVPNGTYILRIAQNDAIQSVKVVK